MLSKNGQPRPKPVRKVVFPVLPAPVLVNCLVDHGLPRRHAVQWMDSPQMTVNAQYFYFDVIEAENGDRDARERVDYCRYQWQRMKEAEKALGNDPEQGAVHKFKLPSGHEVVLDKEAGIVSSRPISVSVPKEVK